MGRAGATTFALALLAACTTDVGTPHRIDSPPAVVIVAPPDATRFDDDQTIEFIATVQDDNGLSDIASVTWRSNLQGVLADDEATLPDATGTARLSTLLASGTHTVEIVVEDQAGLRASDALTVRVDESEVVPVVEITWPGDQAAFDLGESVELEGTATDPDDAPGDLLASWSAQAVNTGNVRDLGDVVPDGDGFVAATLAAPAEDLWRITLQVEDLEGNVGTDRIDVYVQDPDDLDRDEDGFTVNQGDCDDDDPTAFPGNPEVCDLVDNDCNGVVDDKDRDLDLHIDELCTGYVGALPVDDCDDDNPSVHGAATEIPDGVDNDCDGHVDEGSDRFDDDGDCFCEGPDPCTGSIDPTCTSPAPGDCDDAAVLISPADTDGDGLSACDGDCDDTLAELNQRDDDGDGWTTCDGDCDDDPQACGDDCFPGNPADDVCDGHNQDCDADLDEDADLDWYPDRDGDGFTDVDGVQQACTDPDGAGTTWVASATADDCDDDPQACGAACWPGNPAADVCDGHNQDCDADVDEDPEVVWYHDADGDGFTDTTDTVRSCTDPDGLDVAWVSAPTAHDCDDNPGACGADCWPGNPAADVCDGHDQDCDTDVDEDPEIPWYRDGDGDGWTRSGSMTLACTDPDGAGGGWVGAASSPTDCDDGDPSLNHDDDDGDGFSTCADDCDDDDRTRTPEDADSDGLSSCEGDCDDDDGRVRPGFSDDPDDDYLDEDCDGIDGDASRAVFVATWGSDTASCGTLASPCGTVDHAATTRADALGRSQVYVQDGDYTGTQAWWGLDRIEIYGGYDGSWTRDHRSQGGHQVTFSGGQLYSQATGLNIDQSDLYLENVIVQGPDASGTSVGRGKSSYAIHVEDSILELYDVAVVQGDGADGLDAADGSDASQTAAPGGSSGGNAREHTSCCDDSTRVGGGAGASNPSCPSGTGGGSGGAGGKVDTDCTCSYAPWDPGCDGNCNASSGLNGQHADVYVWNSYGMRGSGGGRSTPGGNARNGRTDHGVGGGPGQREGSFSGDWWYGGRGGHGTLGQHGTGGGGGGGSGGCDEGFDDLGAGGGGGGAGGCRAPSRGYGGYPGGSSFGILAMRSTVDVRNSDFTFGNGGDGGRGGDGGLGQPRGPRGTGGNGFDCADRGGHGGYGGWGGHSGSGGGGSGGNVYGIFSVGSSVTRSGNAASGGSVGSGGSRGTRGIWGSTGETGSKSLAETCASTSGC